MRSVSEQAADGDDPFDIHLKGQADDLADEASPAHARLDTADDDEVRTIGDRGGVSDGRRPGDLSNAALANRDSRAVHLKVVVVLGIHLGEPVTRELLQKVVGEPGGGLCGVVPSFEGRQQHRLVQARQTFELDHDPPRVARPAYAVEALTLWCPVCGVGAGFARSRYPSAPALFPPGGHLLPSTDTGQRDALPDAVLFDMDGLLVDTEPQWYAAETATVRQLGGVWGKQQQVDLLGSNLEYAAEYMRDHTGTEVAVEAVLSMLLDNMTAELAKGVTFRPGVGSLLADLSRAGVPLSLVTSSVRLHADMVLACLPEAPHG